MREKAAKFLIGSAKAMENEAKFILVGWEEKNNSLLEGISNVITVPNTKDTDALAEYYSLADVFVDTISGRKLCNRYIRVHGMRNTGGGI